MKPDQDSGELRGFRLGRTRLRMQLIARGGLADVYRGDADDGRSVTVKFLQTRHAGRRAVAERWAEERKILRSLPPAPLPRVVANGRWRGRGYLAYDYIAGESALELLRHWSRTVVDESVALAAGRDLLDTLDLLHRRDIVHGDISPENLIWDGQRAHLIDFGCAQRISGDAMCTRWIGKAHYMSPEQARGDGWDQRSDLYQAGIVLYEMLAGQRFNPATDVSAARVWASQPSPPDWQKVPARIRPLLHYMLNPDPATRARSAAHCRDRLGSDHGKSM